jgi:soluble lytic murein transglycosylase-like protein
MGFRLSVAAAVLGCALVGPAWADGPRIATTPTPTTEIHGIVLPDPVAAGRRDAALRQARHSFVPQKAAVGNRYPAVINDGKLLGWVNSYSKKNRLDPRLVYALIEQESRFNPRAVSPKGAQGLMQIMPDTQHLLGLTEPFDAERNIAAGTRYLRDMLDKFQTEVMALAAYNAGPGAVAKHGGVPPYEETKDYVLKVVDRYFFLRLRYPEEGIGAIHKKLAEGGETSKAVWEKP